jgi:Carboxypeptidase regulatory-like domain
VTEKEVPEDQRPPENEQLAGNEELAENAEGEGPAEELAEEPPAPAEPMTGTLRVRLAAAGDEPLRAGTEVRVAGLARQLGEGGVESMEVPAGDHVVAVVPPEGYEASGFTVLGPRGGEPRQVAADQPVTVWHEGETELAVILVPTPGHESRRGSITGTVQDPARHGLGHVRVVLGVVGGGARLEIADTDGNGEFTFTRVKAGSYTVAPDEIPTLVQGSPWRPPAYDTGERLVTVVDDETAYAEAIVLEPMPVSGAVTGFVLDVTDRNGLDGVDVELVPSGGLPPSTTHSGGQFGFPLVVPGQYLLRIARLPAGYRLHPPEDGLREIAVVTGQTLQVRPFLLEPVPVPATVTGAVRGWVRLAKDARGVGGVRVEAKPVGGGKPYTAKTNKKNGSFTIANLPPGDYRVGLSQVQGKPQPRPQPPDTGERNATVEAGGVTEVATILLAAVPATGSVTGRVLDARTQAGIEGIRLVLRATGSDHGVVASTKAKGRFKFGKLAEGGYLLRLEQVPSPDGQGTTWEPVVADAKGGQRTVVVRPGTQTKVDSVLLEPERHRVFGTVRTRPDGPPVPFAEVRVRDLRGNTVAALQADVDGEYEFRSPTAGTFLVEFVKDGVRQVDRVEVQSDTLHDVFIPTDQAQAFTTTTTTPAQDLATFPLLTESVTPAQVPAPSGALPSGVGQAVESALREALGWRPRAGDPRGFSAALAHSFELREVQGHTEVTWTPRTYAAQVQADLGAITGAQASLYSRARVALDAALPLLDGLYPLDPAFDPQDTEAIRAIVRAELNEVVAELGVEGGPRIGRVDELLNLLLGGTVGNRGTALQGQLKLLQDRFGLVGARVETVEEEEDLTNFIILVDYVREIDSSWTAHRGDFDPATSAAPFLGTQLVLISRSLSVVAESVEEVNFTLDSVFIGAAERQTIRLTFPAGTLTDSTTTTFDVPSQPSILLGDLLSWVERVATEEGPQLLQDGGKDGAAALASVLNTLRQLVRRALVTTGGGQQQQPGSSDIPDGYATERVQRALRELAKYLDDTFTLADKIHR